MMTHECSSQLGRKGQEAPSSKAAAYIVQKECCAAYGHTCCSIGQSDALTCIYSVIPRCNINR